jgi:hypothetical protein
MEWNGIELYGGEESREEVFTLHTVSVWMDGRID